ncbi:MAG: endo alpha-1,4 polygalactosaminidase [Deltaproteobacteria bacterium]|nr:endo alpha-1,4 polygalactosaminidase [Deltaproteobacteria bacterium]
MTYVKGILIVIMSLWISACGGDDDNDDEGGNSDWSEWTGSCTDDSNQDLPTDTTWQWQLLGTIDTSVEVEMYDVDLFDAPDSIIEELRAAGRKVICYFSAGSWEDWRNDAGDFPGDAVGTVLEGWENEKWVDVRSEGIRGIMLKRLDYAAERGCDGVEPDNMDGYLNESGFSLTGYDQLDYNAFIAEEAHKRGLSVGLKNDVDQLVELEPCFDWALNEECLAYKECDKYAPFVSAGKAVFHVEYVDSIADGQSLADEVCGDPSIEGFSTLIKEWDLEEWLISCD